VWAEPISLDQYGASPLKPLGRSGGGVSAYIPAGYKRLAGHPNRRFRTSATTRIPTPFLRYISNFNGSSGGSHSWTSGTPAWGAFCAQFFAQPAHQFRWSSSIPLAGRLLGDYLDISLDNGSYLLDRSTTLSRDSGSRGKVLGPSPSTRIAAVSSVGAAVTGLDR